MKELDTSRRDFLAGAAAALTGLAITATGLPTKAFASAQPARQAMMECYAPGYFDQMEWCTLITLTDILLPDDETGPGAVAALVPVYIDRQMQTEYGTGGLWYMQGPFYPDSRADVRYQHRVSPREIYRIGLKELADHCQRTYGKRLDELDASVRAEVVTGIEKGTINFPSMPSTLFFSQLLTNVKEGFFADPMYGGNRNMAGWKMIGFPGAQGDYRQAITRHNQNLNIPPVSIKNEPPSTFRLEAPPPTGTRSATTATYTGREVY